MQDHSTVRPVRFVTGMFVREWARDTRTAVDPMAAAWLVADGSGRYMLHRLALLWFVVEEDHVGDHLVTSAIALPDGSVFDHTGHVGLACDGTPLRLLELTVHAGPFALDRDGFAWLRLLLDGDPCGEIPIPLVRILDPH